MNFNDFLHEWQSESDVIELQTSGSTGEPKRFFAEKRRMAASARCTIEAFRLKPNDRLLLCLPVEFIAGKMMVVRACVGNLKILSITPSANPMQDLIDAGCSDTIEFAAFVPLQIENALKTDATRERLASIKKIIVGGAPISSTLASALKPFPNEIYSTYAMTETFSHIALRRLSGAEATEWYTPMSGITLSADERGCLIVCAPKLAAQPVITNDIVQFSSANRFQIVGRIDNVINSGAIKIFPEKAESILQPLIAVPFAYTSIPHATLGEAAVLAVAGQPTVTIDQCKALLPQYWQPKKIVQLSAIPQTKNGKIDRLALRTLVRQMACE